jgi:hypothetical protein
LKYINSLNMCLAKIIKKLKTFVFFRYISIDNNVSYRYIYNMSC